MDSKRISRRSFLRIAAMSASGMVLAQCTTPPTPTEAPAAGDTPAAQAPAGEDITLRMWHWDNFLAEGYKPIADEFTADNPNVTIAIEMTAYGEYSQKVAASIAGGTPPDVAGTIAEHFTNMAGQGQLVDLKPYIDGSQFAIDDYHPGNLSQNSWGGALLSIPYTADGMWWFYNVDAFTEKGVKTPYEYWKEGNWTWETVAQLAEEMTSGEGLDKNYGVGPFGYGNYFEVLPYMASNSSGLGLFDEQYTTARLTDPTVMDVYQWGFDLRQFAPSPEDQEAGTPQSGRVMQWLDWSPFGQVYAESMPFKYSYAPPPASPSTKTHVFCGDAPGFGILKGVKFPDQSWAWIQRINEPDAIEIVFQNTGQEPPRISVATDPALWERNTKFPDASIGHELTVARFDGAFYNTPKVSNFVEMWNAHGEELSLAWSEDQSLEEALTKANDRINGLLAEATVDQDKLYWTA